MVSSWTQIGSDIDGEAANDSSGWSVSLSSDGSVVAIGAPMNGDNSEDYKNSGRGHVKIFKNVNNTWVQVGSDIDPIEPVGAPISDELGVAIDIDDQEMMKIVRE